MLDGGVPSPCGRPWLHLARGSRRVPHLVVEKLSRQEEAFELDRGIFRRIRRVDDDFPSVYGWIISVRNLGRSAATFAFIFVAAALPGWGAGVVRVATGTPTARKNSSCPAGEQRH